MSRVTGFSTVLMAAMVVGMVAASPVQAEDVDRARQVLDRMAAHYGTLDDVSYELRMHSKQKVGPQEMEREVLMDVKLRQPNSVSLDVRNAEAPGEPSFQIRSDGESLGVFHGEQNRYSVEDAPESLEALTSSPLLMQATQGLLALAIAPLTDEPLGEMLSDADSMTFAGTREFEGTEYDVVRLENEGAFAFDLYLTQGDTPRLRQVVIDLSAAVAQAQAAGQPIESAEASFQINNWQANTGLDDAAFAFTAPEGAEEVASLTERPKHPLTGSEASAFELEEMGGENRTLAAHAGKDIVILDFWATWCGPCVSAMPLILEVASENKDNNVVLYAVNQRETEEEVQAFLEEHGMDIDHVLMDRQGQVAQSYGVEGIPQTVVIGKDGKIHNIHVGFSPDLKKRLQADIEELLAAE
ncbi:MAG: redoxin family protein [Phycisphaeraceae bacterium]